MLDVTKSALLPSCHPCTQICFNLQSCIVYHTHAAIFSRHTAFIQIKKGCSRSHHIPFQILAIQSYSCVLFSGALRDETKTTTWETTMGDKGTWDCVEKPVRQRYTPIDNFLICFGFIPSFSHSPQQWLILSSPYSPQKWLIQCYGQKSNHFHPWRSKFNFVWGGWGGVASFTNISRKVPTLLTSIVATTNEFNFQLTALQSLEFTNSGAPRSEAPQLRKFGNRSIRENLVMTSAYDLPSVQTLGEGKAVRRQPVEGGVYYSLGEIL